MKLRDVVLENMVTQLLLLCKHELGIQEIPKIKLISQDNTVGGGTSFGEFDGTIKVVTKDRHPMDVMRTLAHELVHWKQRLEDQELDGNDGSTSENDANAIAGVIMRKFGRIYPEYFISSLP